MTSPQHPKGGESRAYLSIWRGEQKRPPIRLPEIATSIAEQYGVTVEDLKGQSRHAYVTTPRLAAYAAAIETGRYSLAQIGRFFGGRDHSTIHKGAKRHLARAGEAGG